MKQISYIEVLPNNGTTYY